ncbi:MAG TPA: hypothetical protein VFQ91_10615 [Bryobacteraceae bacterium]|nr:hypothetical protein [Bryobacteraceae bacterium]
MRKTLPYLLLLPTVVTSTLWWRAEQSRRTVENRIAQLEAALKAKAPEAAAANNNEPEDGLGEASQSPKVVRVPTGTDPSPYIRTIDELREQITSLGKDLSAAKDELARAEARITAEVAEQKKGKAEADDLREDALAARRVSDALQAELKAKSERLVKAEASENLMKERLRTAEESSTKVSASAKELEDLNRRREAYLTTLLRRYREVSDLYRNFALNAQTRESPAAGLQAGDLSRIQSAMQQAEDDLRQMQALSARMAQLLRTK